MNDEKVIPINKEAEEVRHDQQLCGAILQDALGRKPHMLEIAVVIHVSRNGKRRIVFGEVEHGDEEAIKQAKIFVKQCKAGGFVKKGAALVPVVMTLGLEKLEGAADHVEVHDEE